MTRAPDAGAGPTAAASAPTAGPSPVSNRNGAPEGNAVANSGPGRDREPSISGAATHRGPADSPATGIEPNGGGVGPVEGHTGTGSEVADRGEGHGGSRARLRFCAWCGPAFTVLFAIGFWPIAGLVPPPSPALGAAAVAGFYATHAVRIHLGVQLGMIASALFLPFVALMSVQLKRIEGRYSPLAYAQLAAGCGSTMVFLFPLMNLQSAAFRADRAPGLVQAISDMSWIPFVGLLCVPALQNVCLAVAILTDRAARPLFPRWSGYLNIWVGASYLPAILLVFVHSGPVAWNGVFSWWLGAAAFFLWILAMTPLLLRAIDQPHPA